MKQTLYIFNDYYIGKSNDTIQCTKYDGDKKEKYVVPIQRIKDIIIQGNIKISLQLLSLCNKHSIPIYFSNYYGKPIGYFYPKKGFSPNIRIKQYECFCNAEKRLHIAQSLITKTISNRIHIIKKFDSKKEYGEKIKNMEKYRNKIQKAKNSTQLMGLEANAMKNYYSAFGSLLKFLDFGGKRTKQPPQSNANALLSFGNVMTYHKVSTYIYTTGLDNTIGFLHEPQNNRNTLTLDLSEIFKPYFVDDIILRLDHSKRLSPKHFEEIKDGGIYLNNEGKEIWTKQYKSNLDTTISYNPLRRRISVEEEIQLECYNLIKYIVGEKETYNPLQFKLR